MVRKAAVGLLGCVLLGIPGVALAQDGFGIHGGATVDPDQGFVGAHFITEINEGFRLHVGGDVGFGDDVTVSALRIDFAQWFELGSGKWSVYFGGGTAVNFYRFDEPRLDEDGELDDLEIEGGFDAIVGFASQKGPLFELRVGSNGSPDLRFLVGFTF